MPKPYRRTHRPHKRTKTSKNDAQYNRDRRLELIRQAAAEELEGDRLRDIQKGRA
jgi:hypothetical protein